jgi:isoquinoline 1-oxidoreductase alpha subunit
MALAIKVNGTMRSVDVDNDAPLLWVLRDALGLTGTKFGCGVAQCGACTVFVEGKPMRSCTLPISALGTREVTTIEGVSGREAEAVQQAWIARDVPQCGYCQSGQVMSAVALLMQVKKPSDRDIDLAMNGNVCRCATYVRIRAAIHDAARAGGLSHDDPRCCAFTPRDAEGRRRPRHRPLSARDGARAIGRCARLPSRCRRR